MFNLYKFQEALENDGRFVVEPNVIDKDKEYVRVKKE